MQSPFCIFQLSAYFRWHCHPFRAAPPPSDLRGERAWLPLQTSPGLLKSSRSGSLKVGGRWVMCPTMMSKCVSSCTLYKGCEWAHLWLWRALFAASLKGVSLSLLPRLTLYSQDHAWCCSHVNPFGKFPESEKEKMLTREFTQRHLVF